MAVLMTAIHEGMRRYVKSKNDVAKIFLALVSLPGSTLNRLYPNREKLLSSGKSIHFPDKPVPSCSSQIPCKLLKKKKLLG